MVSITIFQQFSIIEGPITNQRPTLLHKYVTCAVMLGAAALTLFGFLYPEMGGCTTFQVPRG